MMKQEISGLMDGELFDDDAEAVLDKLKRNPEAIEEWATYHLISEVLRQPDSMQTNISIAIRERLQAEPTVLAPRTHFSQDTRRWYAFSAAASVIAFSFAAWLLVQNGSGTTQMIALQQPSTTASPGLPANGVNDYLMAHQEASASLDVYSMNSYVHTVAQPGDR